MADPSKTENATPRKREEFRKKGSIAKSIEISTALILLTAYLVFRFTGPFIYNYIVYFFKYYLININKISITNDDMTKLVIQATIHILVITIPILVMIFLIVIIGNLLQVGFLITMEPIKPNLNKLNIIKGFKNLFSKRSLENLVKDLLKVAIIGYLVYSTIKTNIPVIVNFFNLDIQQSFFILCQIIMAILFKIIVAFIVIAVLDYLFQRYSLEEQMRMSKQEVKEEYKRTEGDPLVKGEIRRRQQEMARHRMMSEVPKADVVVTNPFHIAVALRYDAKKMVAPQVVAKGTRMIAENIKELARNNNVPIMENPPIARALYKSCKVGESITTELYSAVAEILTYIYKLSGKTFGI